MHMRDTFRVMSALRLVKNDKVFWRNGLPGTGVILHVILDVSNKRLASSPGVLQGMLEYLNQGSVTRQVNSWR